MEKKIKGCYARKDLVIKKVTKVHDSLNFLLAKLKVGTKHVKTSINGEKE